MYPSQSDQFNYYRKFRVKQLDHKPISIDIACSDPIGDQITVQTAYNDVSEDSFYKCKQYEYNKVHDWSFFSRGERCLASPENEF